MKQRTQRHCRPRFRCPVPSRFIHSPFDWLLGRIGFLVGLTYILRTVEVGKELRDGAVDGLPDGMHAA